MGGYNPNYTLDPTMLNPQRRRQPLPGGMDLDQLDQMFGLHPEIGHALGQRLGLSDPMAPPQRAPLGTPGGRATPIAVPTPDLGPEEAELGAAQSAFTAGGGQRPVMKEQGAGGKLLSVLSQIFTGKDIPETFRERKLAHQRQEWENTQEPLVRRVGAAKGAVAEREKQIGLSTTAARTQGEVQRDEAIANAYARRYGKKLATHFIDDQGHLQAVMEDQESGELTKQDLGGTQDRAQPTGGVDVQTFEYLTKPKAQGGMGMNADQARIHMAQTGAPAQPRPSDFDKKLNLLRTSPEDYKRMYGDQNQKADLSVVAQAHRNVITNDKYFSLREPEAQEKTLTDEIQRLGGLNSERTVEGQPRVNPPGTTPQRQSGGQGGGKQLDPATAAQILQEAGGDKNKARQIARKRGFKF